MHRAPRDHASPDHRPSADASSYDELPYAAGAYPQSHPARLALIAHLFGLTPPAVERGRVLELGCAEGGNLLPLAAAYPDGRFVGVDLSARQVADGHATIAAAGLGNVQLHQADIRGVDASFGSFDFIVCHGVFSWVPAEVQDRILAICRERLAPGGLAYVSYNTYPGWRLRDVARDVMLYHTRGAAGTRARIAAAGRWPSCTCTRRASRRPCRIIRGRRRWRGTRRRPPGV